MTVSGKEYYSRATLALHNRVMIFSLDEPAGDVFPSDALMNPAFTRREKKEAP
jgi:hypothetical protein